MHKATTALLIFIIGLTLVGIVQAQSSQQFSASQIDDHGNGYSLALDNAGNPHVLFSSWTYITDDLNQQSMESTGMYYAALVNNSWVRCGVDDSAYNVQLKVDSTDCPQIIYMSHNDSQSYLRYATLKNGTWESQIVDTENSGVGSYDFALDNAGNPHIVYTTSDNSNYQSSGVYGRTVKYAVFNGEKWVIQNIEYIDDVYSVSHVSIALNSKGLPAVTYFEGTGYSNSNLKYAYLVDSQWHSEVIVTNCSFAGKLALDTAGQPGIIYKQINYITGENGGHYQTILGYGHKTETGWQLQRVNPESDPLERSNKFFLNYDSKNNPRVYLTVVGDVKQGNGSLLYTYLAGSDWQYGNLGRIDIGSTYIDSGPYIGDMTFDSHGNPAFIASCGIGTTRGAHLTGNLMYFSMKNSFDPLEDVWLPITIAVPTIAVVIAVTILFENRSKKAKATTNIEPEAYS